MATGDRVKKRTRSTTAATHKTETVPKKRKVAKEVEPIEAEGQDDDDDDDSELNDQTAALLKGFESSDDEGPETEEFTQGQEVPSIPNDKKVRKKLDKANKAKTDGKPGVIYVGRIPHGFYEHEMRAYFSQFGDIQRLRLSRNRKTGQSKHYAFIEFKSLEVAQIVADTMNNYLMFGHILKCQTVLTEQVHENLWKGANKRFKKVPWNKLEGRKLEMARPREEWERKIETETKRRTLKQEKLKAIGYDFEPPVLKSVDEVPVTDAAKLIAEKPEDEAPKEDQPALIEAAPGPPVAETEKGVEHELRHGVAVDEVVTKKVERAVGKKSKKAKAKTGSKSKAKE